MDTLNTLVSGPLDKIASGASSRRHGPLIAAAKGLVAAVRALPSPVAGTTEAQTHVDALSDEQVALVLSVARQAQDTKLPRVVEASLELLQRLVAHGLIRGDADALPTAELEAEPPEDVEPAPEASLQRPGPAAAAVELLCRGYELGDEAVELAVLKGLLTSVSVPTFQVHGEALLRVVRTAFNVFLGSRSEVNQNTAKATLTQALTFVFHRMEADSALVPPPVISVTDLLFPGGAAEEGGGAMAAAVQSFVNKARADLSGWSTAAAAADGPLLGERDGAFASGEEEEDATPGAHHAGGAPGGAPGGAHAEADAPLGTADAAAAAEAEAEPPCEVAEECGGERLSPASAALRRDALLVFRALAKLSMKSAPDGATAAADAFALRGRVLSLELLKILLANAGPVFRSSPKFAAAIKTHLCRSLLKNCAAPAQQPFSLSCSIFIRLLERFRPHLKAEIGIFTEVIFLAALEAPAGGGSLGAPYSQRVTVLRCLGHTCRDAQLCVDLFVNYDCDRSAANLFERTVGVLLRLAKEGSPADVAAGVLTPGQDVAQRVAATRALTDLTGALGRWIDGEGAAASAARAAATAAPDPEPEDAEGAPEPGAGGGGDAARYESAKTAKSLFKQGVELFNKKPKKGVALLQKERLLGDDPAQVALFLRSTPDLDKTQIGELLGSPDEGDLRIMHAYVDALDFPGQELDEAIRAFLLGFRLPGEAQKIDRLMEKFAERFCRANPGAFKNADTAYVLSYSVIMLNTDAHNPGVKVKMSKADFIKNNRGIDDGSDVPEAYMSALYDRITRNEIKMKDASLEAAKGGGRPPALGLGDELAKVFLNLIPGRKALSGGVDPAEAIMEAVRDRERAGAGWFTSEEAGCVRPMWAAFWEPLLRIVSSAFEVAEDKATVLQCLDFLRAAVHLGAALGLDAPRDAAVQHLAKHTSLGAPAAMRAKHVEALRVLITAAEADANNLGGAWVHVLRAVSRYEHLHGLGAGFNDASLFNPGDAGADQEAAALGAADRARRGGGAGAFAGLKGLVPRSSGASPPAPPPAAPPKKRVSPSPPSPGCGDGEEDLVPPPKWVLDALSPDELSSKVFLRTHLLDSDAVVAFVRALCAVSLEELDSHRPRVYSLAKIVEIAHFNMDRIRLVWSRIWTVLADFFVTVGLLKNLSVAMYVVDSLRQLSMKFLARDELANYSFQNDFLRPYVVVMRNSHEVAIRELIIRCMSQMVAGRVGNIKSGWKSMFMVFTTAASDSQRSIVVLAFETIERIMRQHFNHIVETDSTAFTDCVNCLVAFTNSRCSPEVSLNAIAFLRFCALKLAEGALGNLEVAAGAPAPDGAGAATATPARVGATFFTDADAHLYLWFPLLVGLSELTFDSRRDVRHSALEVLFDMLKFHGAAFSPAFWDRVFDKILFPIFDAVRAEGLDAGRARGEAAPSDSPAGAAFAAAAAAHDSEVDAWLFETCSHCLHLIVDLFAQFFASVSPLLPRLLALLQQLALRPHEALSASGVAALSRLVVAAGPLFDASHWGAVVDALSTTLRDAAPPERVAALAAPAAPGGAAWLSAAAEARCAASTQLALLQAAGDVLLQHAADLPADAASRLTRSLADAHERARAVNADAALRAALRAAAAAAAAECGDAPPALRLAALLPDPPLLALEVAAGSARLQASTQLLGAAPPGEAADAERRLAELVVELLAGAGGQAQPGEAEARAPLVCAALRTAWENFSAPAFARAADLLLPASMALLRAEGVHASVRDALATLIERRLFPPSHLTRE